MENKVKLTPYGEEVYIKLKNEPSLDTFGRWGPGEKYYGKTVLVKRTGSHTWQLVKSLNGWFGNFPVEWVQEVYTKETHPQFFIWGGENDGRRS